MGFVACHRRDGCPGSVRLLETVARFWFSSSMSRKAPATLTEHDWKLATIVAEDLRYLATAWTMGTEQQALRRESPILRRLLVEGDYARCWNLMGLPGQPMVRATDLDEFLKGVPRHMVRSAFAPLQESWNRQFEYKTNVRQEIAAGSVLIQIVATKGLGLAFLAVPPDDVAGRDHSEVSQAVTASAGETRATYFRVDRFLNSPAIVLDGVPYSRRVVVSHVANRLGGAHFDNQRRKKQFEQLDALKDLVGELTVPFLQLLSIGQFVADSSDSVRYIEAVESGLERRDQS